MTDPYASAGQARSGAPGTGGPNDDLQPGGDGVSDALDQRRADALAGAGRVDEARAEAANEGYELRRDEYVVEESAVVPGGPGRSRAGSSDVRSPADDRSIGDIMGDLTRDVSTLMRQEVALAKAEVNQSAKRAGKGAGMLGGAGVGAIFVLSFLSLAAWWAIGRALADGNELPSLGLSGLIVAGIWAIIAAILAAVGKSEMNKVTGLQQTTDTAKQIPNALKGNEEENR